MSHDLNDERWSAYPETLLEFPEPDGARIDLRRPLADADRRELTRRGLDRPFAVITAENPCSLNAEDASEKHAEIRDERNRKRMADFVEILERDDIRFQPVDGVSPDGQYREHSLAVLIDRDHAVQWARRLDQLAIFWFDRKDFWLVAAERSRPPEKLPRS